MDSFLICLCPFVWISIVISISTFVESLINNIHGSVLSKICHPTDSFCFLEHILLNHILHCPLFCVFVRKIYHSKFDTKTINKICFVLRVFQKVTIFIAFFKQISSNVFISCEISEVWVHVDHRSDTFVCPVFNHLVPFRVMLSI
jgi:hypothetical protein